MNQTDFPRLGERLYETPSGIMNSIGLQNPGVRHFIEVELPQMKQMGTLAIANLGGASLEDYMEGADLLSESDVDMIELNISCPNVHNGGMSFGTDPRNAAQVTRAVKEVCKKPVYVKLTPNVTDIVSIASACADAGADGLSLINTLLGMRIDLRTRRPVIANTMGGFSGRAIQPVALRMVYQVYGIGLPIMGMGGVATAEDVVEMMLAGATAVQVGAENLVNPTACRDIIGNLPVVMERYGIQKLSDIIGQAH